MRRHPRLCRGFRLAPGRSTGSCQGAGPVNCAPPRQPTNGGLPARSGAALFATADRARLRAKLVLADGPVLAALEELRAVVVPGARRTRARRAGVANGHSASVEHAVRGLAHRADGDSRFVGIDPLRAIGHDQRLDRGDFNPLGGLGDIRKDGVQGGPATLSLALYEDAPSDGGILLRDQRIRVSVPPAHA